MRILVTNDDGVHALGLNVLAATLKKFADVTIVAPLSERSTTGHTLTLDHPLRLVKISEGIFGCDGYPADCSLMGIAHVMKENRPDVVISGINRGANLGQDLYYSGTVAAAREATFRGIPSLAVSSSLDLRKLHLTEAHFQVAADFIADFLKEGLHHHINKMELLNINVPDRERSELRGVAVTKTGFRRYSEEISVRQDFKEREYYWVGGVYSGFDAIEGSDCLAVDQNKISITPLNTLEYQADRLVTWEQKIKNSLSSWR